MNAVEARNLIFFSCGPEGGVEISVDGEEGISSYWWWKRMTRCNVTGYVVPIRLKQRQILEGLKCMKP